MQHKTLGLALCGVLATGAGCATTRAADEEPSAPPVAAASVKAPPPAPKPYKPGEMAVELGNEPDSAVGVELERGFLNQNDVNSVLEANTPRLIACYDRAGEARRYAAGVVKLRFLVAASGEVTDVLVIENQLGNYPVERCLVMEGRKIPFPKPGGDRPADFDYDIEFRSTHPHTVVDVEANKLGRKLTRKVPSLGSCGAASAGPVGAVAYVRPGGRVVSVGLTSEKPLDTMAAKCVVDKIATWRLPGQKDHLVRTQFAISKAKAEPAEPGVDTPLGPTARLRRGRRVTR